MKETTIRYITQTRLTEDNKLEALFATATITPSGRFTNIVLDANWTLIFETATAEQSSTGTVEPATHKPGVLSRFSRKPLVLEVK